MAVHLKTNLQAEEFLKYLRVINV